MKMFCFKFQLYRTINEEFDFENDFENCQITVEAADGYMVQLR